MKKISILFATLCICFITCIHALPSPKENTWVHDFADIISDEAEDQINEIGDNLNGNAQIVVVTVNYLDGMSIDDYAFKLFNSWGIGDSQKNNGILLLVSMGEEQYYALKGEGLEKTFKDSALESILDDYFVDALSEGEFDKAFIDTSKQISKKINSIYSSSTSTNEANDDGEAFVAIIIVAFIVIVMACIIVAVAFAPRRRYYRHGNTIIMPAPRMHHHHHSHPGPRPMGPRPSSRPSSFGGSFSRPSGGHSSSRSFGGGSSRGGGVGGGFGKH